MGPAARILPLVVSGLMMASAVRETEVTAEGPDGPSRREPTWRGGAGGAGERCGEGGGWLEGRLVRRWGHLGLAGGGEDAVERQDVVGRELDRAGGVLDAHLRARERGGRILASGRSVNQLSVGWWRVTGLLYKEGKLPLFLATGAGGAPWPSKGGAISGNLGQSRAMGEWTRTALCWTRRTRATCGRAVAALI